MPFASTLFHVVGWLGTDGNSIYCQMQLAIVWNSTLRLLILLLLPLIFLSGTDLNTTCTVRVACCVQNNNTTSERGVFSCYHEDVMLSYDSLICMCIIWGRGYEQRHGSIAREMNWQIYKVSGSLNESALHNANGLVVICSNKACDRESMIGLSVEQTRQPIPLPMRFGITRFSHARILVKAHKNALKNLERVTKI